MSHTKGPWSVEPVLNENDEQFWDDDWNGKVFCVCHTQTQCDATTVVGWINEGDARLIAQAPTMLDDLIEAERMFRWYGDLHAAKPDPDKAARNYEMADRLAGTIAKATGAGA